MRLSFIDGGIERLELQSIAAARRSQDAAADADIAARPEGG
jgi:hypothetical protein